MKRVIAVVSAGLRRPSSTRLLADRLGAAAERQLRELGDEAEVRVVEVRDHAHDLVDAMISNYPSPELQQALDVVAGADGLIAVTPTFNASGSGLFKMFFDVVGVLDDNTLAGKPVLIAATGGTARHSLVLEHSLRPLFAYLGALTVPTSVFAAPEDWGGAAAPDLLAHRVDRAAAQLAREIQRQGGADLRTPAPFDGLLDSA